MEVRGEQSRQGAKVSCQDRLCIEEEEDHHHFMQARRNCFGRYSSRQPSELYDLQGKIITKGLILWLNVNSCLWTYLMRWYEIKKKKKKEITRRAESGKRMKKPSRNCSIWHCTMGRKSDFTGKTYFLASFSLYIALNGHITIRGDLNTWLRRKKCIFDAYKNKPDHSVKVYTRCSARLLSSLLLGILYSYYTTFWLADE